MLSNQVKILKPTRRKESEDQRGSHLNMIFLTGPGHGPAIFANTYLEGTFSEFYPDVSLDAEELQRLFKQFSFQRD